MAKELTTYSDDFDISTIMTALFMLVMVMAVMAILPSITATTAQAQHYLAAQAYTGLTNTLVLRATSTIQWMNLVSDPPYTPLITATFYNDGPNSVFIAINNPAELLRLNKDDSRIVSMSGGERRIEFIFYKCNPGESATVRVDGKY